jgi:hypothetical protein
MGRKRTLNYRDFRGDFDESGEGRKKEDEDEVEEEEDEDEDEEEASETDEEEEGDGEAADEEGDEEEAPKKKPAKAPKKPAKPRVKKPRAGKVIRMRVIWGVFNNSNQKVASFDYKQENEAKEHAAKLAAEKKQTFFVQPVKEAMEEQPAK